MHAGTHRCASFRDAAEADVGLAPETRRSPVCLRAARAASFGPRASENSPPCANIDGSVNSTDYIDVIDHISIPVRDLADAGDFYDVVLAPLGLTRRVSREATIGYGKRYPEFWLNLRQSLPRTDDPGGHVCLRAPDVEAVLAFHAAALANGGTDAGKPGPRAATMTAYFGAFILDRDGNKLEAVNFPHASARLDTD